MTKHAYKTCPDTSKPGAYVIKDRAINQLVGNVFKEHREENIMTNDKGLNYKIGTRKYVTWFYKPLAGQGHRCSTLEAACAYLYSDWELAQEAKTKSVLPVVIKTQKIDRSKITQVYSGKVNRCCCGCSGTHTDKTEPKFASRMKYICDLIEANWDKRDDGTSYLAFESDTRVYIAYFS